jgi:leucyl aminopeptidase
MFSYTKIFKKNIDVQVFVLCNNIEEKLNYIIEKLNVDFKIPKTFYDKNLKINKTLEKRFYFDNYEILFIFVDKDKKCDNKNLYEIYGNIGMKMYEENKNVQINFFDETVFKKKNNSKKMNNSKDLINNEYNIILKNKVVSYILGYYNFNYFKSNKNDLENKKYKTYFYHPKKKMQTIIEKSILEANIQNELRSLINMPANILNSTSYLKYIQESINNINNNEKVKNKINIKVINQKQLKKIGCNLILGVNAGSKNEAMMIILEYNGSNNSKNKKPTVIIGKGVMFDSGGYNIKSGDFSDMKNDMTGSAIVYGLIKLFAENNLNGHFIGLLPLVENMVDSNSIRPGDILTAYNKKTVEVIDTDAEGRLILADALAYSKNFDPYMCIDIATLTGQVGSIFSNKSSVIMGNDNKSIQEIIHYGIENNEKIWELPMWEEYIDLTKSNNADYKNYSKDVSAGTIMGGAFLYNFVPPKVKWVHLDIAGTDNLSNKNHIRNSGASAEILRTLFSYLSK